MVGNEILWNGAPTLKQSFDENALQLTKNNGQPWNGRSVRYTPELSSYLPIVEGTNDISTGRENTLFLPSETIVTRLSLGTSLSNLSWKFVGEGNFLTGYSMVSMHQRPLPPGAYIFDNINTLYLFDGKGNNAISENDSNGM